MFDANVLNEQVTQVGNLKKGKEEGIRKRKSFERNPLVKVFNFSNSYPFSFSTKIRFRFTRISITQIQNEKKEKNLLYVSNSLRTIALLTDLISVRFKTKKKKRLTAIWNDPFDVFNVLKKCLPPPQIHP